MAKRDSYTSAELDSANAHGDLKRKRRHIRVGDRGNRGAALFGRGVREHRAEALRQRRGEVPVELQALCAIHSSKGFFFSAVRVNKYLVQTWAGVSPR